MMSVIFFGSDTTYMYLVYICILYLMAYYLNYLFCAAKIASLTNKSIVRLVRAAKNLRLPLLNHHHFTQVIIFCVLQNSNGLFKGSLKKSALFLQQNRLSEKVMLGGQDTLFLFHFYQDLLL